MPLINYVKLYGADVAKVLEPDEQLIDMGLYQEPLIADGSRLERTVDEVSPRMRRAVERHRALPPSPVTFAQGFDVLRGGPQASPDRINRLVGGICGEGGADSIAGRLWRAAERHDGSSYYAVTVRRLLLLAENLNGSVKYQILFDLPRSAVASAALSGKLLFQRGRVEVRFTDGSMKAWTPGIVFAARGRSLVAALSGSVAQPGTP
jgi:hypothetical protein